MVNRGRELCSEVVFILRTHDNLLNESKWIGDPFVYTFLVLNMALGFG